MLIADENSNREKVSTFVATTTSSRDFYFTLKLEDIMQDNNYIVIQGWMINQLGLSGNELLVYAIIYGFSQDDESMYEGNRKYLAESCNCSVRSIQNVLNSLVEKGYITKYEDEEHGIKFCKYSANVTDFTPSEKISPPREKISLNKQLNNKSNNNVLSKDNTSEQDFDFGVTENKKPNLFDKCLALIDEWTNLPSIRDLLIQYLKFCLEIKSIRGANQWKGMLNTLERVQQQCHPHTFEEIIEQSLNRGWKTFYPINDYQKQQSPFIHIQKSNDYVAPNNTELTEAKNEDGSLKEY